MFNGGDVSKDCMVEGVMFMQSTCEYTPVVECGVCAVGPCYAKMF